MKVLIVAFALIAAVSADVSHLPGHGYNYPEPQPTFNEALPVQQNYLPPAAPHYEPVHQEPAVVYEPVHHEAPVYQPPVVHQPETHYVPAPAPQPQPQQQYLPPVQHYEPAPVAPEPLYQEPAPVYQPQVVHPAPLYQPAAEFSEESGYSYKVPSA